MVHFSLVCRKLFILSRRYMKYLYPFECEKKGLSSPGELQAAIDSNRREGRRPSYTNSLYRYCPSPSSTPHSLLPPSSVQHTPTGLNGLSASASPNLKKKTGVCVCVWLVRFWLKVEINMEVYRGHSFSPRSIRRDVHPCHGQPPAHCSGFGAAAAGSSCHLGPPEGEAGARSRGRLPREENAAAGGGAAAAHAAGPAAEPPGPGLSLQPHEPQAQQRTR